MGDLEPLGVRRLAREPLSDGTLGYWDVKKIESAQSDVVDGNFRYETLTEAAMEPRHLSLIRRAAGSRSDADLLEARADQSAFAEIVARHGSLVWGVCRNQLGDADAEDAFQATFLALLKSSIRDSAALASWLYGASLRISLEVRRQAGRRRRRERVVAGTEAARPTAPDDWADTMAVVHQEVERLPQAERSAFILCVFEGLTQADAARCLARTPGAVAGQVSRAKQRLVDRLTRRGVVPGLVALGSAAAAGAVPPGLVERVRDQSEPASPAVQQLANGAQPMSHFKLVVCAAFATIALSVGMWSAAEQPSRGDAPPNRIVPLVTDSRDWPMGGRTNERNPVSLEKNAPIEWAVPADGAKAKNIRWCTSLGTASAGGPVVSGGLAWVGTNNEVPNGKAPDFAVLTCIRESDGKILSRYLSPRLGDGLVHDCPQQSLSGSPLAEGDRLWFCTNRREVVCLDVGPLRKGTGDSRELWKFDMVKELKIVPRPLMFAGHDFLGSPAAYKDLIFVPTGNGIPVAGQEVTVRDAPAIVCLRKDTGKVVWSDNAAGKNMLYGHSGSPLVIEVGGRGQVIHPQADGWVRAYDAETGKPVWKFDCNPIGTKGDRGMGRKGGRVYVSATPVCAGGRVFFATGTHPETAETELGRLFCIDPARTGDVSPEVKDGSGKGRTNPNSALIWEFSGDNEKNGFHLTLASVAVHDGLAYATDFYGLLHCLDAKTGKQLWWHDARSHIYGNALVVDGKVFVASEEGEVLVFATGRTKKLLTTNATGRSIVAPPVFANGVLYMLTNGRLDAIAAPK